MLVPGRKKLNPSKNKSSLIQECQIEGEEVVFASPMTFMNESGKAVGALVRHYDLPMSDLLVLVDDLHLPFGKLRLRAGGSDGGHNGLKSIIQFLQTERFPRLRIGIQPEEGIQKEWASFVLDVFTPKEMKELKEVKNRVQGLVRSWIRDGIEKTMSRYNVNEGGD